MNSPPTITGHPKITPAHLERRAEGVAHRAVGRRDLAELPPRRDVEHVERAGADPQVVVVRRADDGEVAAERDAGCQLHIKNAIPGVGINPSIIKIRKII